MISPLWFELRRADFQGLWRTRARPARWHTVAALAVSDSDIRLPIIPARRNTRGPTLQRAAPFRGGRGRTRAIIASVIRVQRTIGSGLKLMVFQLQQTEQ
jgi:hypothetical protein